VTVAALVALTFIAGILARRGDGSKPYTSAMTRCRHAQDEAEQRKIAVKAIADARDAARNEAKALDKARNEEAARAREAVRKTQLVEAHLALERGMNACKQDLVPEGLLWLARSLEVVPDDETELRLVLAPVAGQVGAGKSTPSNNHSADYTSFVPSPNRKVFAQNFYRGPNESMIHLCDLDTGKVRGKRLRTAGSVQFDGFQSG